LIGAKVCGSSKTSKILRSFDKDQSKRNLKIMIGEKKRGFTAFRTSRPAFCGQHFHARDLQQKLFLS
jgi:hypothetical protein